MQSRSGDGPERRIPGVWRELRARAALIVFLLSLVPMAALFTSHLDDLQNFNGDESLFIPVGNKIFELYWVKWDFNNPAWQNDFYTFGAINPPVGKYLMGAGSYLAGYRDLPIHPGYDFDRDAAWNAKLGLVPPVGAVWASRLPMALMGLLCCVLLYLFVGMFYGPWAGLAAMWSMFAGGLLLSASRHAMLDAPALAFSLAAMCALVRTVRAIRASRRGAAYRWSALLGAACGVAVGTKLNALLIIGVVGICLAAEWAGAWKDRALRRMIALCGILSGVSSIILFYLLNPFLWQRPIWGLKHLLSLNQVQASINLDRTTTWHQKLATVWQGLEQYGAFSRTGVRIDQWLVPIAALLLVAWALRRPREAFARLYHIPLIWGAVIYMATTIWLPHSWDRYLLPLAPVNALIEGVAAAALIAMGAHYLSRFKWWQFRVKTNGSARVELGPRDGYSRDSLNLGH
jgi:hypothetical protein